MSDPEIIASRLRILVEKAVSTENLLVLISPYVDLCSALIHVLHVSYMCSIDKANCLLSFAFSSLSVKIPVVLLLLFLFYFLLRGTKGLNLPASLLECIAGGRAFSIYTFGPWKHCLPRRDTH